MLSMAGTPMAMIDEREKKKFMKTEMKQHEQIGMFNKDVDERLLINYMLEVIMKASMLLDMVKKND